MHADKPFSLPMDVSQIQKYLPHRAPFMMIDRVVEVEIGKRIVAIKNVSACDPWFLGHFPGNPVMPGVLLVEGVAQASGVLGQLSTPEPRTTTILMEISSSRFRKIVVPGDTIRYDVSLAKRRDPFFWFEAKVFVESDVVAEVSISARLT